MPFPVDIHYIRRVEGQLGVRFPPEYVVRMVREHGGVIDAVRIGTNGGGRHPVFLPGDDPNLLDSTLSIWSLVGGDIEPLGDASELL